MVNETATDRRAFSATELQETPMTDPRPENRETETEDQRRPREEGEPPRPATEPKGSEGSSNSGETATDPATGEENP